VGQFNCGGRTGLECLLPTLHIGGMTRTLEEQLDQVARDIALHNFAEFAELARHEREYFTWSQADQEDFQQARRAGVAHLRDLLARKEELIRKLDAAKMP
jgi:hypothetical protein